jgi:hypothetical protein
MLITFWRGKVDLSIFKLYDYVSTVEVVFCRMTWKDKWWIPKDLEGGCSDLFEVTIKQADNKYETRFFISRISVDRHIEYFLNISPQCHSSTIQME